MKKYKKDDVETSEFLTFKVEKNTSVIDNLRNNPETQIKCIVNNKKTNEDTNVVIKLYHTNQSIHFQGGRRMGKVTSTSLMADHMEVRWRHLLEEAMVTIKQINESLKSMSLKDSMNLRSRTTSGDTILYCDKCSYTTPLKHKLSAHKMSLHQADHTHVKKAIKRKSSPKQSPIKKKIKKQTITKETLKEAINAAKMTKDETVDDTSNHEVKLYQCTECGFIYSSMKDLSAHMLSMHKQNNISKPITINQVDNILTNISKKEAEKNDSKEKEEFIDEEKEKLSIEAENWRKTARDIDLDLKSALKANEKLIKEKLNIQEDYGKCTVAAGHLQDRVHTLEEEIKEVKLTSELDKREKEQSDNALISLNTALDQEDIPKCTVCQRRFQNIENVNSHMNSKHNGSKKPEESNDVMENSEQAGYGTTEDYQLVAAQCKKCDKMLKNNHMLRIHMKTHTRKEQEKFNFETADENVWLNHIVDTHSTVHQCKTCDKIFKAKEQLVAHIVKDHAFSNQNQSRNTAHATASVVTPPTNTSNTTNKTSTTNTTSTSNKIKCFDCGTMLPTREELIRHKKLQHWKHKFCTYFHGTGRGCRFPDRVCINIHRPEEQQGQPGVYLQEFRSQSQEAARQHFRGQEQVAPSQDVRSGVQEGHSQGVRDQEVSWARVAGGHEQVQGAWGQDQGQDVRYTINCRDGSNCNYYFQGNCRYKHFNPNQYNQSQNHHNQSQNQYNQSQNHHNQSQNHLNQSQNQYNQDQNQTNQTQETESNSNFNMQEMKLTLENLVKVVYNLKSISDFPKVNPNNPSQ